MKKKRKQGEPEVPIPKPKKSEEEKKFINRCLSAIGDEYDDNDQALAICYDAWKNKDKEKKSMESKIERRFVSIDDTEIRLTKEENKPAKLTGYFAKFNKLSGNLGGFREKIEKGFFAEALKNSDTVDLFNHDANYILGRVSSGTLKMKEDNIGLRFECDPPDTQLIRDMVLTPIERGDIKGCSFGFRVKKESGDSWEEDEDGVLIRTLLKGGCRELVDGSQVTFPAYPDTSIAMRSKDEWQEQRNLEIEENKIKENEKMEKPKWYVPVENRAKDEMSMNDINSILWDAVYAKFSDEGVNEGKGGNMAYMSDCYQTYCIFRKGTEYFQVDWTLMDGEIKFGEKVKKVKLKKTWVPIEDEGNRNEDDDDIKNAELERLEAERIRKSELAKKQLALKEKEMEIE